jgi:hypothetical protein
MSSYAGTEGHESPPRKQTERDWRRVPAYGPIDAVLGLGLFYVVVDRATPTVRAVAGDLFPGLNPSVVGLALAALLWFVFLVTLLDQVRRQLAALGLVRGDPGWVWPDSKPTPTAVQAAVYLLGVFVGGALAVWLFEGAMETTVALIRVVMALDPVAFSFGAVVGLVGFFVSFGIATHSLDRLLVGGLRVVLAWSLGDG